MGGIDAWLAEMCMHTYLCFLFMDIFRFFVRYEFNTGNKR